MSKLLAFIRIDVLTAASYRMNMVFSMLSLAFVVVPIYYVAGALQPLMADSIQSQGGEYFAFVLVGMIAYNFVSVGVTAIPSVIGSSIRTGTFEALQTTPTRLSVLLGGMMGYGLVWMAIRSLLLVVLGVALGAHFIPGKAVAALAILLLIVLAHLPFGILAASLILAFRTAGPLQRGLLTGSALLGGIYYPTQVIPSWIQYLSALFPLTYGARALRRTVLDGASFASVLGDLAVLAAFASAGLVLTVYLFGRTMAYAKRAGTLMHY
jgi:ABC-2 type transport system permease protein